MWIPQNQHNKKDRAVVTTPPVAPIVTANYPALPGGTTQGAIAPVPLERDTSIACTPLPASEGFAAHNTIINAYYHLCTRLPGQTLCGAV